MTTLESAPLIGGLVGKAPLSPNHPSVSRIVGARPLGRASGCAGAVGGFAHSGYVLGTAQLASPCPTSEGGLLSFSVGGLPRYPRGLDAPCPCGLPELNCLSVQECRLPCQS